MLILIICGYLFSACFIASFMNKLLEKIVGSHDVLPLRKCKNSFI
jgi:hypothetical protein